LIAKAKAKLKDKTVDDTWSPASSSDAEEQDDQSDDGSDGDEQDDEEANSPRRRAAKAALAQIEDEVERIEKALRHSDGVYYPHSETPDLLQHQNLTPPTTTMHSARGGGSYQTGLSDVVQTPSRHHFDDLTDAASSATKLRATLPWRPRGSKTQAF